MKKRFQYVFLIALVVSSCEIRLEDDTRILSKGVLVDEGGSPVIGAEVSVYTIWDSPFYSESEIDDPRYLLGRNYSNADGSFNVTSLFDRDETFSIVIDPGDGHSKYVYRTSTATYTPENLTFNLGSLELKALGTVTFNATRTSGDGNTMTFNFNYVDDVCFEVYTDGTVNLDEGYCFENTNLNGSLNDNRPETERSFLTPIGSTVEFNYSINGEQQPQETFILNDTNFTINIEY